MKTIQIALDGTAASGKSTVAKLLAEKLDIAYLDTGKLYRAVALYFLECGQLSPDEWSPEWAKEKLQQTTLSLNTDVPGEVRVHLSGQDVTERLADPTVERATPMCAKLSIVRDWLLDLQRDLANSVSIVMAGRDIGTVVLPDATIKIYMEASLEERARRRLSQQKPNYSESELAEATADLRLRDQTDANRECAPMVAADDALMLDSTSTTPQRLVETIVNHLGEK